jgi:hypothetical protein
MSLNKQIKKCSDDFATVECNETVCTLKKMYAYLSVVKQSQKCTSGMLGKKLWSMSDTRSSELMWSIGPWVLSGRLDSFPWPLSTLTSAGVVTRCKWMRRDGLETDLTGCIKTEFPSQGAEKVKYRLIRGMPVAVLFRIFTFNSPI